MRRLFFWRNMRRLLSFALLAAIAVQASAQSFNDGFESVTGLPANSSTGSDVVSAVTWRAYNLSSPLGLTGWSFAPTTFTANTGTGYISANFNNTTGGTGLINNWLLSPTRTFNNGDTISFFTRTATGSQWADRLRLALSVSGASENTGDFSTILSVNESLAPTGYPQVWTQFTATVTGLSGPTLGRFAFNYNMPDSGPSGANSNFIGIDDVSYQAVPEPATMAALAMGSLALLRRRKKAA